MRYILSSAVLTAFGRWTYVEVDIGLARQWLRLAPYESTIGYEETAQALSLLLGETILYNRCVVVMQPGDEALVFRLVLPPGSARLRPHDKGAIQGHLRQGHWELGLLTRLQAGEDHGPCRDTPDLHYGHRERTHIAPPRG